MGNQGSPQDKERVSKITQLSELNEQYCATEEQFQIQECCWIQFRKANTERLTWQKNFQQNIKDLRKKTDSNWVGLIDQVVQKNKYPRTRFLKQVNEIKYSPQPKDWNQDLRQIILAPDEVENFKTNLKKSVLVQYGQLKRCHQTCINEQRQSEQTPQGQKNHQVSNIMEREQQESEYVKAEKIRMQMNRKTKKLRRSLYADHFRRSVLRANSDLSRNSDKGSVVSLFDDAMATMFKTKDTEISKESAFFLQSFVKLSMLIENHFKDKQCVLWQIKSAFVAFIVRKYSPLVQAEEKSCTAQKYVPRKFITVTIMEEMLNCIKDFVQLLSDVVYDYYNLGSFGNPLSPERNSFNPLITNPENILTMATTLIFKEQKLYDTLFRAVKLYNRERQQKFSAIINTMQTSPPQLFEIRPQYCLNKSTLKTLISKEKLSLDSKVQNFDTSVLLESCNSSKSQNFPYKYSIESLRNLQKAKAPISKLKMIMECSENVTNSVKKFHAKNSMEGQQYAIDADQILSIFCFITVHANVPDLISHLFILENFATDHQLISVTGYYLSVLTCAVEQLESGNERSMQANVSKSQQTPKLPK